MINQRVRREECNGAGKQTTTRSQNAVTFTVTLTHIHIFTHTFRDTHTHLQSHWHSKSHSFSFSSCTQHWTMQHGVCVCAGVSVCVRAFIQHDMNISNTHASRSIHYALLLSLTHTRRQSHQHLHTHTHTLAYIYIILSVIRIGLLATIAFGYPPLPLSLSLSLVYAILLRNKLNHFTLCSKCLTSNILHYTAKFARMFSIPISTTTLRGRIGKQVEDS